MKLPRLIAIIAFFISQGLHANGQARIFIPKFGDKYCKTVAILESGQEGVDFSEFRYSLLLSKQYDMKESNMDSLKTEMFQQFKNKHYQNSMTIAKRILGIDYTNLWGHKLLSLSYRYMGDSANMNKYRNIEMGLLRSIVKNGNGKSCEASWEAIEVYEEYFVFDMIGATTTKQSLTNCCTNHICDEMDVTLEDGNPAHYYFNIDKMMDAEHKKFEGIK